MKLSNEIIVVLAIFLILSNTSNKKMQIVCIIGIVVLLIKHIQTKKNTTYRLHLLDSDGMNEVLIMDTMIGARSFLFLLDTGYAGPPVLSRTYLSIDDPIHLDLKQRYNTILSKLRNVTEKDEHVGINSYINDGKCLPYTSGCTMKLMGIGSTQEQQADMLMCPMLKIRNIHGGLRGPKEQSRTHADVFVTNSLRHSIHILTCDFLLHHSPCLISIENQTLCLNMSPIDFITSQVQYAMYPATFSGGSFVVPFTLPHGEQLFCTVDTGAPGPICLGSNAIEKIKSCNIKERKSLQQNGVNGENICSEIIEIDVNFAGKDYTTPVFVNNMPTEQVDGYVGLAFLRGFDIIINSNQIGFKRNRNRMKTIYDFSYIASDGGCNLNFNCN